MVKEEKREWITLRYLLWDWRAATFSLKRPGQRHDKARVRNVTGQVPVMDHFLQCQEVRDPPGMAFRGAREVL